MPRTDPLNPPPLLAELREEQPVCPVRLWDGSTAWLLTRYDDVRSVLADPRISANPRSPGYPFLSEGRSAVPKRAASFNHVDPPKHEFYRRTVSPEFTVQRIAALRPRVQAIANALVDGLLAGPRPADLTARLALPLSSSVICELLGVPYADHGFFESRSAARMRLNVEPEAVRCADQELMEYLAMLVERKHREPGDDLIGRLCARYVRSGTLSLDEVVDIVRLLLVNGFETSANMISLAVVVLLTRPDPPSAYGLGSDPADPANDAALDTLVDELLRHQTIVHIAPTRAVLGDLEVRGTHLRQGEGVITSIAAANRDPRVFADPDEFAPDRRGNRHLSFGHGVHYCLGHPLVRLELRVGLEVLFHRIPDLRLSVPPEQLRFKHDMGLYGVHQLPVVW
jgi:cytochrome P450